MNINPSTPTPTPTLPPEILLHVVEIALDIDGLSNLNFGQGVPWTSYDRYYEELDIYRLVCKTWDTLLTSTPSLWRLLDWSSTPPQLSVRLSRSESAPLIVLLRGTNVTELVNRLNLTKPHAHRIQTLIAQDYSVLVHYPVHDLLQEEMPLRVLQICANEQLDLSSVENAGNHPSFTNLRHLRIEHSWLSTKLLVATKLRSLELLNLGGGWSYITEVLQLNPSLIDLRISGLDEPVASQGPIHLPHLRSLFLNQISATNLRELLQQIRCPECTTFDVDVAFDGTSYTVGLWDLRRHVDKSLTRPQSFATLKIRDYDLILRIKIGRKTFWLGSTIMASITEFVQKASMLFQVTITELEMEGTTSFNLGWLTEAAVHLRDIAQLHLHHLPLNYLRDIFDYFSTPPQVDETGRRNKWPFARVVEICLVGELDSTHADYLYDMVARRQLDRVGHWGPRIEPSPLRRLSLKNVPDADGIRRKLAGRQGWSAVITIWEADPLPEAEGSSQTRTPRPNVAM